MKKLNIQLVTIVGLLLIQFVTFAKPSSAKEKLFDWSFKTGNHVLSEVHIDENLLYAGSFDSVFYALSLDGKLQWKFNSGFPVKCKASSSDSIVCFQSGNRLFGLHKMNGNLLWIHQPIEIKDKKPIIQLDSWDFKDSSPVISNGKVYYCNEYGSVFGIDLYTGEEVFKYKTSNEKPIRTKPVIKNQIIYFGDHDGYIYAVNLTDSTLKWSVRTNNGTRPYPEFGGIFGDMIIDNENLYCGIRNSNFQVLNINTGEKVWSYESGGTWISGTPLITDGSTFVGTSDSHEFISLNNLTGKINWKKAVGYSVYNAPLLIDDKLIVFTGDERYPVNIPGNGSINILSKSGEIINSVKLNGSVFNSPVYKDEKIYFACLDSNIYCISVKNISSGAHSIIEMDESDIDLGMINKNNSVTKTIGFLKNYGNLADSLIFTAIDHDFTPGTISFLPKQSYLSGNDSILIRVQISPKNIENGNYQFLFKVESKSSPETIFEKRIFFTKDVINGISVIEKHSSQLKIFPNPFNEFVNFEFEQIDKGEVNLKLFDMSGKIIRYKKSYNSLSGNYSFTINTEELPSQLYYFRFFLNDKPVGSGKFLKK